MMTDTDRPPLAIDSTGTRGLIAFERVDCGHPYANGDCPDCREFASRAELGAALHASQSHDVRMGQTWLSESDVIEILARLDEYDGGRR